MRSGGEHHGLQLRRRRAKQVTGDINSNNPYLTGAGEEKPELLQRSAFLPIRLLQCSIFPNAKAIGGPSLSTKESFSSLELVVL